jgi:hypothetical protein
VSLQYQDFLQYENQSLYNSIASFIKTCVTVAAVQSAPNSVFSGLVFSFLQGGVFIFFMLLIVAGFWSDLKSLILLLS